ncbi:Palmitoyltransferase [Trichostrongylus colubriformis]|uniref:Palmitoyltransferase n=1 Tax=Trichostrongylus colubriformis TaxID=6319 RepID=A0AAN8F9D8_TRICO
MGGTLSSEHHLLNSAIMNAMVIAVSVGSLLKTQLQSLFSNRTTIEDSQLSFLDEDEMNNEFAIFDLGSRWDNFCSIFGKFPGTWLLPIHTTPGDGVNYKYVIRCGNEFATQTPPPRKKRFWKLC